MRELAFFERDCIGTSFTTAFRIMPLLTSRRVNLAFWYARRPRLWKQLVRIVRHHPPSVDNPLAGIDARAWCESTAVDIASAVERVVGGVGAESFETQYAEEVRVGMRLQRECPVKMGLGASADLLYSLALRSQARFALETGVAFGWSSFALLQAVALRDGHLWSTDMPYPLRENDGFVGCVVPPRLRDHWTLLRYPDRDGLPKALRARSQYDLCHYDSDKSEQGRRWAYPTLWEALRPGGVFVSDDVQDNLVFRDFCLQREVEAVVVRVPDAAGFKFSGLALKLAR